MKLIIGNKTVSSWSLRPWILLKHFEIPFEEILVKLDLPESTKNILKYSPSAKVPCLIDDDLSVWESAAIMEYINEKLPEKKMYPENPQDRAVARALSMEMHAGFGKMRELLSFNAKKRHKNFDSSPASNDINRVKIIWAEQLKKSGGPFLFGNFGIADAMYAPVVGRFQTYGVQVEGLVKDYCEAILTLPAMKAWYEGALAEDFEAVNHL